MIGGSVGGARKQIGSGERSIGVVHGDDDRSELGVDGGCGEGSVSGIDSEGKGGGSHAEEGRELHLPVIPFLPQQIHFSPSLCRLPGALSRGRRGCG